MKTRAEKDIKIKEETRIALAFVRVERTDDGIVVVESFQHRLKELDVKTRKLTGETLLVENGKRIMLAEMIDKFRGAIDRAEKWGSVT